MGTAYSHSQEPTVWQRIIRNAVLCAICSLAGGLAISAVAYFMVGIKAAGVDSIEYDSLYIFVAVCVAPLVETLIFMFIAALLERFQPSVKLWVSVLIFGLAHIASGVIKCFLVLWPGFVYAYAYFYLGRTGKESYWTAAIGHFIHNGALLLGISAFEGAIR